MKSKKKLIISLSVAVAVLLIAVVAIISISAALNQNITSKVKVNFKPSQHVIGYVGAKYTFGDTTHNMTTNGMNSGDTEISFAYQENPTTKNLQMQKSDLDNGRLNMPLNADNIIFEFTFKNTGYSDFKVELDLSSITTNENIKLSYSLDKNVWLTDVPEIEVLSPTSSNYTEKICYIKIEADDPGLDANFEGAFLWNLIAEEDE